MSTEQGPSTPTSSNYRAEILQRLDQRNTRNRQIERIYKNYAGIVDELSKAHRMRPTRGSVDFGNSLAQAEVQSMKEELANVYKLKSKNDQDLIDANRKLSETQKALATLNAEKEKLQSDSKKFCIRISELERSNHAYATDNQLVVDELNACKMTVDLLTDKLKKAGEMEIQLIGRIRELDERLVHVMEQELYQHAEKKQRQIQDLVAMASQPSSKDARASLLLQELERDGGFVALGDVFPTRLQSKFEANDGEVNDVIWLSSETFASAGGDKKIRIWKVESNGKQTKTCSLAGCNNAITRMDFNQEARSILGSSSDHGIRLWNLDNQRLIGTFTGHSDKVSVAKFHQNSMAVSGSYDRIIKLWDLKACKCIRNFFPGSTIYDIIGDCPMAGASFISGHFDKKIRFWDGRAGEPSHTVEVGGKVTSMDLSADGQYLLFSTRDDTLSLMDIRNYGIVHIYSAEQFRTSSDTSRCVLSPGQEYCAAGSSDGNVFVWNMNSTKLEKVLSKNGHEHAVLSVAWNPSGRGLLSADKQKNVCLWG